MNQRDTARRRNALKPAPKGSPASPSIVPLMTDAWGYAEAVDLSKPARGR